LDSLVTLGFKVQNRSHCATTPHSKPEICLPFALIRHVSHFAWSRTMILANGWSSLVPENKVWGEVAYIQKFIIGRLFDYRTFSLRAVKLRPSHKTQPRFSIPFSAISSGLSATLIANTQRNAHFTEGLHRPNGAKKNFQKASQKELLVIPTFETKDGNRDTVRGSPGPVYSRSIQEGRGRGPRLH